MGLDIYNKIVVGVDINELVKVVRHKESYEEHDKRGRKTGRVLTEEFYRLQCISDSRTNSFDDYIDLSDYLDSFGLYIYGQQIEKFPNQKMVVGICIKKLPDVYNGDMGIQEFDLLTDEEFKNIKKKIETVFDINTDPKYYFISEIDA